mgnify:CR=1 FL=1
MDIVKRERYVQKIIRLTPTENNYIKNKMDNAIGINATWASQSDWSFGEVQVHFYWANFMYGHDRKYNGWDNRLQ